MTAFEGLIRRPLLVVDTEFTTGSPGSRIISIAIVPVINGQLAAPKHRTHLVVNPGVPIDAASRAVHGFTDADVALLPTFAVVGEQITAALSIPDAVLVSHTAIDASLLRAALTEAGQRVPPLPLLDTSRLPKLVNFHNAGRQAVVALAKLAEALQVEQQDAHDALNDAEVTAEILVKLLSHAASHTKYGDIDDLLAAHGRRNLAEVKLPGKKITAPIRPPLIDTEHLAQHAAIAQLSGPARAQVRQWLDLAEQCLPLRCPYLRAAAKTVAPEHGKTLWRELTKLIAGTAEPGQAGTLLGAMTALLETPGTTALTAATATTWWGRNYQTIDNTPACAIDGADACPDCIEGAGCPRHTIHEPVGTLATFGTKKTLSQARIKEYLIAGTQQDVALHQWPSDRYVGWMVYQVVTWARANQSAASARGYLRDGIDRRVHLAEPHLGLLAVQSLRDIAGIDAAQQLATTILQTRTTNRGYNTLEQWVTWAATLDAAVNPPKALINRDGNRLARPEGRTRLNRFRITAHDTPGRDIPPPHPGT